MKKACVVGENETHIQRGAEIEMEGKRGHSNSVQSPKLVPAALLPTNPPFCYCKFELGIRFL